VGDTNGDGNLTSADLPANSGDIRLKPQADTPATGQQGEIAYSSADGYLYAHDGSSWVKQGGGGGGGWYVPTSIKVTAATHNGAFGTAGYQAMYNFVQSDSNCGAGYHVCSGSDIVAYFQFHPQVTDSFTNAWYNSGYRDGPSGPSLDCEGWRVSDSGVYGPVWYRGFEPYGMACNNSLPVMCCQ